MLLKKHLRVYSQYNSAFIYWVNIVDVACSLKLHAADNFSDFKSIY